MEKLIVWALTVLTSAFIGSYLGAYLRKKGENLATHEDIDKLVDQVRAVTRTTKEIEAKISTEVWDRQKRWELKRDVLFEATRRLAEVSEALLTFGTILQVEHKPDDLWWKQTFTENSRAYGHASMALGEASLLVAIVCSKETNEALNGFILVERQIAAAISQVDADADTYNKFSAEVVEKRFTAMRAIRKELEIDRPG